MSGGGWQADLRSAARSLGGDVCRGAILCPGPGHGPRDRSLSVRPSVSSPDGFLAHSFAGDDWRECRDHVRSELGIVRDCASPRPAQVRRPAPALQPHDDARSAGALALWRPAVDPRGTVAERYLASRGLTLADDVAGPVLRWHSGIRAVIAFFRDIETNAPHAVSRTYLDVDGRKLARRFLGPVGGAAIKIDADEVVSAGLYVGEGIETCLPRERSACARLGPSARPERSQRFLFLTASPRFRSYASTMRRTPGPRRRSRRAGKLRAARCSTSGLTKGRTSMTRSGGDAA